MAVLALADETAGARFVDLLLVVAPMLVDAELAGLALVAGALPVLVQVAADRHLAAGLHQRLVVVAMHPDLPGPVLAELDARGAERTHGIFGPVPPRLGRGRPLADDPGLAALEPDQQAQVVPLVGFVGIGGAVRVHALDVDDVDLARAAVDLVALALHGGDDEMGQVRYDRIGLQSGNPRHGDALPCSVLIAAPARQPLARACTLRPRREAVGAVIGRSENIRV
jgi:hypothetical protein